MDNKKIVYVDLHHPGEAEKNIALLEAYGANPVPVKDLEELLSGIRNRPDAKCYMDLNYGFPNSPDPSPSVQTYNKLEDKSRFFGVSGNSETIKRAIEQGIPGEYLHEKPFYVSDLIRWVKSP
jgi:hypothetical protein